MRHHTKPRAIALALGIAMTLTMLTGCGADVRDAFWEGVQKGYNRSASGSGRTLPTSLPKRLGSPEPATVEAPVLESSNPTTPSLDELAETLLSDDNLDEMSRAIDSALDSLHVVFSTGKSDHLNSSIATPSDCSLCHVVVMTAALRGEWVEEVAGGEFTFLWRNAKADLSFAPDIYLYGEVYQNVASYSGGNIVEISPDSVIPVVVKLQQTEESWRVLGIDVD